MSPKDLCALPFIDKLVKAGVDAFKIEGRNRSAEYVKEVTEAYREAIKNLAPRGRLVVFSGLPKEASAMEIDLNQLHYLEQTVVGAYGCSYRHSQQAMDMIESGQIKVQDMISHNMPLDKLDEALDIVEQRQGMKVLLYP